MFLKIGFTQFVNIGYQTYFRNDFFLIVEAFVKSTFRNNMLEEGNYKKKECQSKSVCQSFLKAFLKDRFFILSKCCQVRDRHVSKKRILDLSFYIHFFNWVSQYARLNSH